MKFYKVQNSSSAKIHVKRYWDTAFQGLVGKQTLLGCKRRPQPQVAIVLHSVGAYIRQCTMHNNKGIRGDCLANSK